MLFAMTASGGSWKPQRHLAYIDRKITDAISGRGSKRLIITVPPRHGKSLLVGQYVPAWFAGMYPDKRTIFASYEADFAAQWGRKARGVVEAWGHLFGVQVDPASRAANRWEILGRLGGMQTAGAGGALTGKGADLLICDDPIKNAEEAYSQTIRDKIWDWWLSTAFTRLEPGGVAVVIHTRWHPDDLIGRLIKQSGQGGQEWEVINFPAIAESADVLGRKPGEALWPSRFNIEHLREIEREVGPYWFSAQYQQRPTPIEGGMFKRDWFRTIHAAPKTKSRVRYWDLAATEGGGDYTVGTLVGIDEDGEYVVLDVVRVQAEPSRRDRIILDTAIQDGRKTLIRMEQEPGAAGVSQMVAMGRLLEGFRFKGAAVTGSKIVRADSAASQAGCGRVKILSGAWNRAWLDELSMFPNCDHDDQVDSFSGAFNALIKPTSQFKVYV